MADNQLYEILGVPRTASVSEIKKAYRKLAKELHPDKNPAAGDRMKNVTFAYNILSDPEKKNLYDRYGLSAVQESPYSGHEDMLDPFSSSSLFNSVFGNLGGMGGIFGMQNMTMHSSHRQRRRAEPTVRRLEVNLEDLYNGRMLTLPAERSIFCTGCKGKGSKNDSAITCSTCEGRGMEVRVSQIMVGFTQRVHVQCRKCMGEGQTIRDKDKCAKCQGRKIIRAKQVLQINIEPGMKHSQEIYFKGKGDQLTYADSEPGDYIVVLEQQSHERFSREGDDLKLKMDISLTEALCGFETVLKHLDGRNLVLRNMPGEVIQPNAMKVIEGEGMPLHKNPSERGNLLVQFDMKFPENNFISELALKKLESFLPPAKPFVMPEGDVEEVCLAEFDPNERRTYRQRNEAYGEDDDDPHRNSDVQCAYQ